jgi:sugar phosphate permease
MNPVPRSRGLPPAGRFALLAALCSSVGQTFFIGLFGADFRAAFGLSDAALGALYSSATLVSGIAMFWLGALADHVALRRAVAGVLVLLAAGAWLVAIAPAAWALLPGLFLVRLAGQGLMGHLGVVAAGRYAVHRKGRALAMVSYGFIVGEALLPPVVALALSAYDWRAVWLCASVVLVVIALPLMYVLARPLTGNPAADAEREAGGAAPVRWRRRGLLTQSAFLRVLLVVLVPPVLITALFLHQGSIAERLGWSRMAVGQAFVGFAAAQGLAAFVAGRLIDRFSARALLRFQLLPAAAGTLALGTLGPVPALWAMFCGLGLTAGFNGVVGSAIWVELFGTRQLGMIRGVYAALMVLGTALGPVLLGGLLDAGVSLLAVGLGVAVYVALVPPLAAARAGASGG